MSPSTNRSHNHLQQTDGRPNVDEIEQVDSGHPSLETSTTTSPNETVPPSAAETPTKATERKLSIDDGVLKMNPFVVNGIRRAPNKIILEPIEHPIKEPPPLSAGGGGGGTVPRHLFAAKKPQ